MARADIKGIEVTIGRGRLFDLLKEQRYRCTLTGMEIGIAVSSRAHQRGGSTASVDRIDSSQGYVEGNVQRVHKDVNRMKWELPQDRFIEICRMVAKKHE
jgi:hypothetical protein